MIDTIPYAVGFVIYILFNIITFDVYSKGKTYVNHMVLYMIYIYYTLLAGYVINLVEKGTGTEMWITFLQVIIYAIAGGLFMTFHYKAIIQKDKKFADKENSF